MFTTPGLFLQVGYEKGSGTTTMLLHRLYPLMFPEYHYLGVSLFPPPIRSSFTLSLPLLTVAIIRFAWRRVSTVLIVAEVRLVDGLGTSTLMSDLK